MTVQAVIQQYFVQGQKIEPSGKKADRLFKIEKREREWKAPFIGFGQ